MFSELLKKACEALTRLNLVRLAIIVIALPSVSTAEIIWRGDFSTGDFSQWHGTAGPPPSTDIQFHHMPEYGRPIQYGSQNSLHVGNGDLASLVSVDGRAVNGVNYPQGPTRGPSNYAVKMAVKSAAGGGVEPDDCDYGLCERRRTALTMQATHSDYYNALPYQQTRWISFSMYLPSDFDTNSSSWGGAGLELKPKNEAGGCGNSGAFGVYTSGNSWKIHHYWNNDFPVPDLCNRDAWPYWETSQYTMDLTTEGNVPFPSETFVPDLLADYPDVAASQAALDDLNLGGWTDWVIRIRPDARPLSEGGAGFIDVWKRAGDGPWTHVVHIVPRQINYGGNIVNRGIGYNVPATNGNNGGYGIKMQIYAKKSVIWNDPVNTTAYYANIKIGDENTAFAEMSPDGSTPDDPPVADGPPPDAKRPEPPSFN